MAQELWKSKPQWADGMVIVRSNDRYLAYPVKQSSFRRNQYYYSTSWKSSPSNLNRELLILEGKAVEYVVVSKNKYITIRPR